MKIGTYVKESYSELVHKTTWPTWKELQNSAIIVMVASIIIALIVFVIDFVLEKSLGFIYSLFY
jgi:preprotein translocase subunit SecE